MATVSKGSRTTKVTLLLRSLVACLIVLTLSFATISTRAGDAEDKANQAFADWKAANQAVADAKAALEKARAKQQIEMDQARYRKKNKKKDDAQDKQLEDARNEVAAAEAALEKAEAALLAARIALEKAIAELPDGELKDKLKRERLYPSLVSSNTSVKTGGGLTVVTFSGAAGTITVYLPDGIRAGDTISGTVVAEPKEIRELTKFSDSIEGQVVVVGNQKVPVSARQSFVVFLPGLTPSGAVITPDPKITQPTHPSGAIITPDPKITTPPNTTLPGGPVVPGKSTLPDLPRSFFDVFIEPKGGWNGRASIPLGPPPPTHPSGAIITPDPKITQPTHPSGAIITPDPKITKPIPDAKIMNPEPPSGEIITITGAGSASEPDNVDVIPFKIPPLGQTGKPIVITGPFDGISSNTLLDGIVPTTGATMDTPESYYAYPLIAESPRKAVFETPRNVTGPIEVKLKEGNVETKGTFRNVGVSLSAPTTSLMKDQTTEVRVDVGGLQGITAPVPLTLQAHGVITMVGGNYQPLTIQPSQVGPDGHYTTTRGITGVQAGGWGATATVVTGPFNVCLQDDSRPATVILWNTVSGDYSFSPPGSPTPTEPGSAPPVGKGTMIMKGCILTLQHNAPDRRVFATLDTCTNAGSATVETPANKAKVTITDRNTTDNTCAAH